MLIQLALTAALIESNQVQDQIPHAADTTFKAKEGFDLRGEIVLPPGAKHAVLLLPGSGPTDRNGSQPPYLQIDLLRELAKTLSQQGVASLRFDKRALASYASHWPTDVDGIGEFFAYTNFVADAEAAFKHLLSRVGNDVSVGVLGHSEGGLIALSMANNVEADFIVAAATPGRSFLELVEWQLDKNLKPPVVTEESRNSLLAHNKRISAYIIANGKLPGDVPLQLTALYNPSVAKYWQQAFGLAGAELLKEVKAPVLVVQAQYDAQVDAELDFELMKAAAKESDTTILIPNASHNFKQVQSTEQPGFTGPVISEFMQRIADWIKGT